MAVSSLSDKLSQDEASLKSDKVSIGDREFNF